MEGQVLIWPDRPAATRADPRGEALIGFITDQHKAIIITDGLITDRLDKVDVSRPRFSPINVDSGNPRPEH